MTANYGTYCPECMGEGTIGIDPAVALKLCSIHDNDKK